MAFLGLFKCRPEAISRDHTTILALVCPPQFSPRHWEVRIKSSHLKGGSACKEGIISSNSFLEMHLHLRTYILISDNLLFCVTASVTAGVAVVGEQLLCMALPRLEGFAGASSEKLHEYMTLIIFQVCASCRSPSLLHCCKMKITC